MLDFQESLITPEKSNEIFRLSYEWTSYDMNSHCDNTLSHSLLSEKRNYGILKRDREQSHANTCVLKKKNTYHGL